MSVITQPIPHPLDDVAEVPTARIYRLSVEQYHQMLAAGILKDGDPVELLKGLLVRKMGKNPPHRVATGLTREVLDNLVPAGWFVDSQEPITTDDSEPEPDISVVRGNRRQYNDRHPGPHDAGLLVEVADSSLEYDRGFKKRVYAEARVPVYWIVNIIENVVEVYTDPSGPGNQPDYRKCQIYNPAEEIPVVLDGQEVGRIAVRDLLP
jgi:Uma2 family endonuclease